MLRFLTVDIDSRFALCFALCFSFGAALQQDALQAQDRLVQDRLKQFDKNQDGKIGKDEAPARLQRNFAAFDTDKDGFLDLAELREVARQAARPNRPANRSAMSTARLLQAAPEGVVVEPDVAYRDGASKAWRLDLVRPEGESEEARPAILFVHGGGWRSGDKRRGYFVQGAMEYAKQGYVCASINYRLTGEAPFPACIEDAKCAVRWLRANADKYGVDPNRIGGYGNSAGAHLVAMLGMAGPGAKLEGDGPHLDQSSMLNAVCCSATPTNMLRFERALGAGAVREWTPEEREQLGRKVSPLTYVTAKAPPFLVVHGTADGTVPVEHGDKLVKALQDAGAKGVEYIRIDGAGHGVFNQHAKTTHPAMKKFFAKHLSAKP